MNRALIALLAILGLILITVMWFVSAGNSLVAQDESVKSAWAEVENVYQRRMDLIPNLVATVKGYATHEQETLEKVVQARSQAISPKEVAGAPNDPKKLEAFQKSQDALGSALGRLMVVVEKYPDLKASENFRDLQVQLEGTENRIAVARKRFNDTAQEFNSSIRMFPASIVAGMRGLQPRAYFQAQAGAYTAPKVKF